MKRQWLSWVLVRIQWKHWMMFMETFLLRLQETGAAFSRLQITRRKLRKEASWGHTSISLNAVTAVPNYPLNFMPSKHNLLKPKKMRLLTYDMGSSLQSAGNGVSQRCDIGCVNSINGRVLSTSGVQIMTKEHLVCFSGFKGNAH